MVTRLKTRGISAATRTKKIPFGDSMRLPWLDEQNMRGHHPLRQTGRVSLCSVLGLWHQPLLIYV